MTNSDLLFLEGFVSKCAEMGIDPEAMLKAAQAVVPEESMSKRVGKGALLGGGAGAAGGAMVGSALPLIAATVFMAKHPELRKMITVADLAKSMASMGAMGAGAGGLAGASLGAVARSAEGGEPTGSKVKDTLIGAGKGMLAGGVTGGAFGAANTLAHLIALKARGGRASKIPVSTVMSAFGKSTAMGAGLGAAGGAGVGGVLGAVSSKRAAHGAPVPTNLVPPKGFKGITSKSKKTMGITGKVNK